MDDVPDYPPGPKGPEDSTPGVRLRFTPEQLRFTADYTDRLDRVDSVTIAERGACYFEIIVHDVDGGIREEDGRAVAPLGNRL